MQRSPKRIPANSLAHWKAKARERLEEFVGELARQKGINNQSFDTWRKNSPRFRNAILALDPIKLTVRDPYGGSLTCTYDIGPALSGLRSGLQSLEASDSDIAEFAKTQSLTLDKAMDTLARRYMEAEILSTVKTGRFLHTQLESALKEILAHLSDAAFLRAAVQEYGYELVEAPATLEKYGREHGKLMKQMTGLVSAPGRRRETAVEREQRRIVEREAFVREILKADETWYSNGHRRHPSQSDRALLVYGGGNKESAASRFSRRMKNLGLTRADLKKLTKQSPLRTTTYKRKAGVCRKVCKHF